MKNMINDLENNMDLIGIDRPNLRKMSLAMAMSKPHTINTHGLSQGEGKTTCISKLSLPFVKLFKNKGQKYVQILTTPVQATADQSVEIQGIVIELLLEAGYEILFMCRKEAVTQQIRELTLKYRSFVLFHDLDKLAEEAAMERSNNCIILATTTNQMALYHKDAIFSITSDTKTTFMIDEADTWIGVSCAEIYQLVCENSKKGWEGNYLKKVVFPLREKSNVVIHAFTGTPTKEQRGVVVNSDLDDIYTFFDYEPDDTNKKEIKEIVRLVDENWNLITTIKYINFALKKRSEYEGGVTQIVVSPGDIQKLENLSFYDTDMKNVIFYSSDKRIRGAVLTKDGYKTIVNDVHGVKKLLQDPNRVYNIFINIRAGSRGLDIPEIDTQFLLGSTQKVGEQHAWAQAIGRANRACGNKQINMYLRENKGTVNAMMFYLSRTFKNDGYRYRKYMEMLHTAKRVVL